jgi:SAM-dependent MidA family methyltransferase
MTPVILPEPSEDLKRLSDALSLNICREIDSGGPIPFSRYMELCLYEPGLGYYSAGLHKLGAAGDFVTAPELGSLFAHCLAAQVAEAGEVLERAGKPYEVLEVGAGNGKMAADILMRLGDAGPSRYRILERSADLREVQRRHIGAVAPRWLGRVEWLDQPPSRGWDGIFLANEVADALAVERFRISGDLVEQACVTQHDGALEWAYRPAPEALKSAVQRLDLDVPDGYCSEINLMLPAWLAAVTSSLRDGAALLIDYGYPRREFYLPERSDGTLICHYRHRAHDDVFFYPGLQDMTAFVDFTALAEAGDTCGFSMEGYTNQAMFLLGCGLDQVLSEAMTASGDGAISLAEQARQLTLPGAMGERFQVMALARGLLRDIPGGMRGFGMLDLSYRL